MSPEIGYIFLCLVTFVEDNSCHLLKFSMKNLQYRLIVLIHYVKAVIQNAYAVHSVPHFVHILQAVSFLDFRIHFHALTSEMFN